ncbi:glycoside hydrolase family 16 protein [Fictibacillus sp. KU28468]|uniref:glycoside hydrolase family 16 protein n=1 Tax=Fictibacillus sp. KU28468 TaxID=2991053 RepID=UPI00223D99EC|nr:glycoside hydrolase family 16 protein [Fictibacillus sp. KU28468]UZJ79584.1 glycoside hydrolase family 16 protein [Fictibacillus sp. KU28468]
MKRILIILGVVMMAMTVPVHSAKQDILRFSGYDWIIKESGDRTIGPGPNYWSRDNAWVDKNGKLHLIITKRNGIWYCPQVVNTKALGYGTYRFYVEGRIDQIDPNAVIGLYTYDSKSIDAKANNYREIDIEFSDWGNPQPARAQYTIQPSAIKGNSYLKPFSLKGGNTTHSFTWEPKLITFSSIHGHYKTPPSNKYVISSWTYKGANVPNPSQERASINYWLFRGNAPQNKKETEIVIKNFEFIPYKK